MYRVGRGYWSGTRVVVRSEEQGDQDMSQQKRTLSAVASAEAPEQKKHAPEQKKHAGGSEASTTASACALANGSSSGGFAHASSGGGASRWGDGGGAACSWGSGVSGGGFAAIASASGGFGPSGGFGTAAAGAAQSDGPRKGGFASFSGSATTATTFTVSVSPPAARSGDHGTCPTPTEDPPVPVEPAACTGEEDEICVHRVRAKLFQLQV